MSFIPNSQLEGTAIGSRIRLDADVRVLKGLFPKGSILRVTGAPDMRGEFLCVDEESGESVAICHGLASFTPLPHSEEDR